jgi:ribosomal protein L21E
MTDRKPIRTRGKIPLSRYFQELKKGDSVAVVREKSLASSFPTRLQGRTGKVDKRIGKSYLVRINDQTKEKEFIISPVHLRKITNIQQK